ERSTAVPHVSAGVLCVCVDAPDRRIWPPGVSRSAQNDDHPAGGGALAGPDRRDVRGRYLYLPRHGASGGLRLGPHLASHRAAVARKSLLLADSALFAIGSLISALAPEATTLIIGRVIIGLAIGADSAIATAYIAEFAPKKRRGGLSIIQQWMITIGILGAYV